MLAIDLQISFVPVLLKIGPQGESGNAEVIDLQIARRGGKGQTPVTPGAGGKGQPGRHWRGHQRHLFNCCPGAVVVAPLQGQGQAVKGGAVQGQAVGGDPGIAVKHIGIITGRGKAVPAGLGRGEDISGGVAAGAAAGGKIGGGIGGAV